MINVMRVYKRQAGGYKKVVGPIPEKALALRSGAFKYVYLNNEDRFLEEKVYILQDILKGVTYKSGCSAKVIHYSDSGIQLNLHTNSDETLYVAFPPNTKLETILSLLDIVIDSTVVINKMIPMIPEQFIEL